MQNRWVAVTLLGLGIWMNGHASPTSLSQDGCLPRSGAKSSVSLGSGSSSNTCMASPNFNSYMLNSNPNTNSSQQNFHANPSGTSPIPSDCEIANPFLRFQWQHNAGYCGETSLIIAGLYYGQYLSQYAVRQLIDPSSQTVQSTQQVLLEDASDTDPQNAATIATALHLNWISYPNPMTADVYDYLAWIKSQVLLNYPVIIGVFMNYNTFYGCKTGCTSKCSCTPIGNGESVQYEYDHIVPVIGIGSCFPFTSSSYPSDVLYISDNGLYGSFNGPTSPPGLPNPPVPYVFNHYFGPPGITPYDVKANAIFPATREDANKSGGHTYSVPIVDATMGYQNYGIAITGIIDMDHQTIPVQVTTNVNYEYPAMASGQNSEPASMPLTLTVTVTISDQSKEYYLYKYNDIANVPNGGFNANASQAQWIRKIPANSGSIYQMIECNIQSNEVAVYRCVPTTAP